MNPESFDIILQIWKNSMFTFHASILHIIEYEGLNFNWPEPVFLVTRDPSMNEL